MNIVMKVVLIIAGLLALWIIFAGVVLQPGHF